MDARAATTFLLAAARANDLLELETRRALWRRVADYPGLHVSEIARELAMPANLATYHLRVLERHGLVSSRREAGNVRYYPRTEGRLGLQEALQPREKTQLSLLRHPARLRLVLALLSEDELTVRQLGRRLDVRHATVVHHLARLEGASITRSERDGRERLCRLVAPEETLRLLLDHRPPDALVEGFLEAWEELEAGLEREDGGESIL